jgi:predicted permease
VALAFMLVSTASFLGASVWNLVRLEPGFDADRVLTFEISLPHRRYESVAKAAGFHQDLVRALEAHPGVESAGAVFDLPLSGFTMKRYLDSLVFIERPGATPAEANRVAWKLATPGYFRTLGIPIKAGRWFEAGDHFDEVTRPLVVSESFARRHMSGEPIGRRIRHFAAREWATVVGVVGDVRDGALRDEDSLAVYVPVLDQTRSDPFVPANMSYAVRHRGDEAAAAALVRRLVRERDAKVAVAELQPMTAIVARAMARETLVLTMVLAASGLAVLVGVVGLYGAIAFAIAQRRREIGIRMAIGASPRRLRLDIARAPLLASAAGLVAGLIAAAWLARMAARLLFGVGAGDARILAASAALLGLCAVLAVAAALGRLRRISPVEALQAE